MCGFGINDSTERTQIFSSRAGGATSSRIWACIYYDRWKGMLGRCYLVERLKKFPTYNKCSVCPEWKYFSAFRSWCIKQESYMGYSITQELHLDKDLFGCGKVYSPVNCVFIHNKVNTFLKENISNRGDHPLGVNTNKSGKKYESWCRTPFERKSEYLGVYDCPQQAHLVWQDKKHHHACALADSEYVTDERVADALRLRYAEGTVHK